MANAARCNEVSGLCAEPVYSRGDGESVRCYRNKLYAVDGTPLGNYRWWVQVLRLSTSCVNDGRSQQLKPVRGLDGHNGSTITGTSESG